MAVDFIKKKTKPYNYLSNSYWGLYVSISLLCQGLSVSHRAYPTWGAAWPLCFFPDMRHRPLHAFPCLGWCTSSPTQPCSSGDCSSAPPASCSTPGWRSKHAAPSADQRFPVTESCECLSLLFLPHCTPSPGHIPDRLEVAKIMKHCEWIQCNRFTLSALSDCTLFFQPFLYWLLLRGTLHKPLTSHCSTKSRFSMQCMYTTFIYLWLNCKDLAFMGLECA